MPTYSYACTDCDNKFDVVQSFADDSMTDCPSCDGRLRKLFGKVGVVFKGSGFYRNDSRESKNPAKNSDSSSSSKSADSSSTGSSSSDKSGSSDSSTSATSGSSDKSSNPSSGTSSPATTASN